MEHVRLAELDALVRVARECLEAGAIGHRVAMFHMNALNENEPLASGYRDGTLSSLDEAARAQHLPFLRRTPAMHDAILACLRAYARAEVPLYLVRIRFARIDDWSPIAISLQSCAERRLLARERAECDHRLAFALLAEVAEDCTRVTLSWESRTDGPVKLSVAATSAESLFQRLEPSADVLEAMRRMSSFYSDRSFTLDALMFAVNRAETGVVVDVDDYYG